MTTLKESAQAWEPRQTLNIADLDKVPVNVELKDATGTDSSGENFTYKYAEIEGKEYRVPGTVIGQTKAILAKMPNLQFITVTKQGVGMNTRYMVMPYTETPEEPVN